MVKSFGISFLILLTLAIVETAILSNITILPAVPDLVLLGSIYISLVNGRGMGELSGFSSGLIMDFLGGAPFGFNCIFRTIIAYISGFFGGTINYNGFLIPFVIGLIATVSKAFLIWIISLFYTSVLNYTIFSLPFLFELLANAFLAPVIFKLCGCFKRQLALYGEDRR